MYPVIYNKNLPNPLATLDNIISTSARMRRVVNGEFTFSFSAFESEFKSEYFEPDNYIVIDGQAFDIASVDTEHSDAIRYNIDCEHVNYRLKDGDENLYPFYAFIGTPSDILTNILTGTEFTVGTVSFSSVVTLAVNQEITRKDLIYQLANMVGGEIDYTNNGFTINLLNTIGQNNGFEVRFGKNLLGLNKNVDKRGGLKTSYKVDVLMLKNTPDYLQNGFGVLEQLGPGDMVRIIDDPLRIDVINRVVAMEWNPIFETNNKLEIANQLELLADKIYEVETNMVKLDHPYNMTSISSEYGVQTTRSDKLARSTLGAGTLALEKGDGLGNYIKNLYFDAYYQAWRFSGDVIGSKFIGGSIDIGSGTFKVDQNGNVIANSIQIGGGSGLANFSDAGNLALKDYVDLNLGEVLNAGALAKLNEITSTYITDGAIITPKLATGAIIADKIASNSVTADKLFVTNLSAITANLGTVTAGNLYGVTIDGAWINANTFSAATALNLNKNNIYDLYMINFHFDYESTHQTAWMKWFDPWNSVLEIGPSLVVSQDFYVGGDISDSDGYMVASGSGQKIKLQYYNGKLEYRINGGSFVALANA